MKQHTGKESIKTIIRVVIVLTLGIILGLWQLSPPHGKYDSPDFQRMMGNIQKLAAEPHPPGSAEIESVRTQLLAEITNMGLSPVVEEVIYNGEEIIDASLQVQGTTLEKWWAENKDWIAEKYGIYSSEDYFSPRVGEDGKLHLKNILVTLDSTSTDTGILFVSHYDSTSKGPGAADDMVAVCSMLEAMRAQAQNQTLENDLYFLFTDGEDSGLLGSRRFVRDHTQLKDNIAMVINLEARGNRGGLFLFETSPMAYQLLQATVKSGARPIGFSWMSAAYAMMPNKTDLTMFLNDGYDGINFAVVEGVETYHQPTDSYENLNPSTARQYLNTTITLADYAANNSFSQLQGSSKDAVYFTFLPGFLVLIDYFMSHILCGTACGLSFIYGALQIKNKRLKAARSTVLMGLLILLSIGSAIFFTPGSYLFYIPLLVTTITLFFKERPSAYLYAKMVSGVIALILWVPVVYLLWISLVQPMLL